MGMSVTYLSRTFKSETNMNFVKYLVQVRMEKRGNCLQESLSAQEAAYRVGFGLCPFQQDVLLMASPLRRTENSVRPANGG